MKIAGRSLGDRDPIVFWSDGKRRRVVVPLDYSSAKELVRRCLDLLGSPNLFEGIQRQVGRLAEPGEPVSLRIREHTLGLVRPYCGSPLDRSSDTVMICAEVPGRGPAIPILVRDRDVGRALLRELRRARPDLEVSRWRAYDGEWQKDAVEKLLVRMRDGTVVSGTILEQELRASLGLAPAHDYWHAA